MTRQAWYRTLQLLACTAAIACRVRGQVPTVHGADERRCGIAPVSGERVESIAVRCAERVSARNGYTEIPLADTSVVATESIEYSDSRLAIRRNSLGRRAVVVCRGSIRGPGYTAGFLAPNRADTVLGRAVTMDSTFRALRVEHRDYLVARARADTARCQPLPL